MPTQTSTESPTVLKVIALTALAMLAFAGNSVLCRMALKDTSIDAASFTAVRLVSGALMLYGITRWRAQLPAGRGNWLSALALFAYAATFSFAYIQLSAATGALLLFGAVQLTMVTHGLYRGERLRAQQVAGMVLASAGLLGLMLPGLAAPPLLGATWMVLAGVAWGLYSVRGKGGGDPTRTTAGNFGRAAVMGLALSAVSFKDLALDSAGLVYAVASGAVTSGLGYAIWYRVLPALRASSAAVVQLSVPLIAALGGIVFVGESLTTRFALASIAILGGITLVTLMRSPRPAR